jgi:hypothetical protein
MKHARLAAVLSLSFAMGATAVAAAPTTRPATAPPNDRVEQLIQQLGAEDFKTRAAAASQLRKMGRSALPALKQTRHQDAEVESWCASLADQLDPKPAVAQLTANDLTVFKGIDGRIIKLEVGVPVINRAVRGDLQRLVQVRQLLDDRNAELLGQVEAEILDLTKKLEEPVNLRLNLARVREPVKPAERAAK